MSRARSDICGPIDLMELHRITRFEYTKSRDRFLREGFPLKQKGRPVHSPSEEWEMLETIIIILLVLWLLGVVSSYTLGGALHMLLVAALVILVVRLATGRRIA